MTARRLLLLAFLLAAPTARAQDLTTIMSPPRQFTPPQQTPGFTVTGRVVCADTQHAARFAQVILLPASSSGEFDRGRTAIGRTDLDGRFTMDNVPPGEYFATAELSGYVNDAPSVRNALNQGGDAANSISGVPRVQVTTGGGTVQISLQRGAVLAGTATWDDGSPAAGLAIGVQPPPSNSTQITAGDAAPNGLGRPNFGGFGRGASTDDRGHFRISGLSPGSYILQASIQSPLPEEAGTGRFTRTINLSVFAPNKLRRSEATVFTLGPAEERTDVTMVINLTGLHNVSGQVSASAAAVRSGTVTVTDQTDGTLNRRGVINPDGTFTIPYVPAGSYTLRVNASPQSPGNGHGGNAGDTSTRFQPLTESVTVTDSDLTGLALAVTTATASQ